MIKTLLPALLITLLLGSCATSTKDGYRISGRLTGAEGTIYLYAMDENPVAIDSAVIDNEKFYFQGHLEAPVMAVVGSENSEYLMMPLENTQIDIEGDIHKLNEIKVSGSALNDDYNSYLAHKDTVYTKIREITRGINRKPVNVEEDTKLVKTLQQEYEQLDAEFVKNNPENVAAAYILFRNLSSGMALDELYASVAALSPQMQNSVYAKLITDRADALKKTAVGNKYTDFSSANKDGSQVSLSSVMDGKRYILVDFWASWCVPCMQEMPYVTEAYKKFKDKGFEVFAVSLDNERGPWLSAIESNGLDWTNVSDLKLWDNHGVKIYGVQSVPSNILIAPDGTIIARNLRGNALINKLEELLH